MKADGGRRGVAPLIPNPGTRCSRAVMSRHGRFTHGGGGETPVHTEKEAHWAPPNRVSTFCRRVIFGASAIIRWSPARKVTMFSPPSCDRTCCCLHRMCRDVWHVRSAERNMYGTTATHSPAVESVQTVTFTYLSKAFKVQC